MSCFRWVRDSIAICLNLIHCQIGRPVKMRVLDYWEEQVNLSPESFIGRLR